MLKKVLIGLLVLMGAVAAVVAMQPAEFRVARTISIAAPPEKIFPLLNDVRKSGMWSPWEKLDPAMKKAYEGPAEGVGAAYSWDGNEKVGAGRLTIVESQPSTKVTMKLENLRPFQSVSSTEILLTPQAGGTSVEWSLRGKKGFVEKAVCMVVSMDKMVGPDFERGLAQLKSLAESAGG